MRSRRRMISSDPGEEHSTPRQGDHRPLAEQTYQPVPDVITIPRAGGGVASLIPDLLNWALGILPAPVRRRIDPAHVILLDQMIQFGTVGLAGFVVDTAVVYATQGALGLYAAGTIAYGAAVTTTWWLNRIWTFRGRGSDGPKHLQWARFALANLPGLCLNLGTYFVLVATVPFCAANPVIPIFAGAIAGMTVNFVLSRQVVFR